MSTLALELPQDRLVEWRKKGYERFLQRGFPRLKQEPFSYLPMSKISSLWPKPAEPGEIDEEEILSAVLPECRRAYLVFVNGHFAPALSQVPKALVCLPMSLALSSYGLFLQTRWAKSFAQESDPFVSLNSAFQGEGAFIYAPAGLQIEEPLQVLQVLTGEGLSSPRLQVTLGKGASLSFVQTTLGTGFSNGVVDVALEEAASLHWLDQALFAKEAYSFFSLSATLKKKAAIKAFHATNGAESVRFSSRIQLMEEESSAEILALAMLTENREAHIHTLVEHAAPHTTSRQHVKPALQAKSRSSFEGKILVRKEAQKTEAYQLNNNLLLSEQAVANSRPNLEIFADDVKATHGATISQLKEDELFYLRSRGLDRSTGQLLLTEGFCRELIDQVAIASVQSALLQVMKSLVP